MLCTQQMLAILFISLLSGMTLYSSELFSELFKVWFSNSALPILKTSVVYKVQTFTSTNKSNQISLMVLLAIKSMRTSGWCVSSDKIIVLMVVWILKQHIPWTRLPRFPSWAPNFLASNF